MRMFLRIDLSNIRKIDSLFMTLSWAVWGYGHWTMMQGERLDMNDKKKGKTRPDT